MKRNVIISGDFNITELTNSENTQAAASKKSVVIKGKDGSVTEVECDSVVNAIGFVPTPVAPEGKNVHLVGDCRQIGNLRTAIWRGWDVCMKI